MPLLCSMADINKKICNYIAKEWVAKANSNRAFALNHDIDEKTVRKILKPEGYRMPITTLKKICDQREITLATFFELVKE